MAMKGSPPLGACLLVGLQLVLVGQAVHAQTPVAEVVQSPIRSRS